MEITLLHHTPIEPLIKATAMPYQSEETAGLVTRVWDSGHRSIARHGMAVFEVKGLTQNSLRQLSRQPHINLTVMSARYNNMAGRETIVPPHVREEDIVHYAQDIKCMQDTYAYWANLEKKYPDKEQRNEVAKTFIGLNSTVDLIVSGNYQALYEMLQLRNCMRAEYQIREMAGTMTKLLKVVIPHIFKGLSCRGADYGICPEAHGGCGRYPSKKNSRVIGKNALLTIIDEFAFVEQVEDVIKIKNMVCKLLK